MLQNPPIFAAYFNKVGNVENVIGKRFIIISKSTFRYKVLEKNYANYHSEISDV